MQSIGNLLNTIGGSGNRTARLELSRQAAQLTDASYQDLRQLGALLGKSTEFFERYYASLATIWFFWTLIPARLFSDGYPKYQRLAERHLRTIGVDLPDEERRLLVRVYKRLRRHHRHGREAASLDLTSNEHSALLKEQHDRCALCKYVFVKSDIDLVFEDNAHLRREGHPRLRGELVLPYYIRRPELDHIVPVAIGGDSPENSQILCGSCNRGKSDAWMPLMLSAGLPPRRISQVSGLTSALRYIVLASASHGAPGELGVFIREPRLLPTVFNLYAIPVENKRQNP